MSLPARAAVALAIGVDLSIKMFFLFEIGVVSRKGKGGGFFFSRGWFDSVLMDEGKVTVARSIPKEIIKETFASMQPPFCLLSPSSSPLALVPKVLPTLDSPTSPEKSSETSSKCRTLTSETCIFTKSGKAASTHSLEEGFKLLTRTDRSSLSQTLSRTLFINLHLIKYIRTYRNQFQSGGLANLFVQQR